MNSLDLPGVDSRPIFPVETGAMNATAAAVVRHLIARGVDCIRRFDGKLFEVRPKMSGVAATHAVLRNHMERHCRFEKKGKPCDPPAALVAAVQVCTEWPTKK